MTYTTEWEAGQCFEKKLSREKAQIDCAQLQNKAEKWYKQFGCSFHQILLFLKMLSWCPKINQSINNIAVKRYFMCGGMKMWKAKVIFDNL